MMPGRIRLKCCVFTFVAVLFFVPVNVEAQAGCVTLQATVSKTVALSVAPGFTHDAVDASVMSSGNTVRITVSADHAKSPVIRVPLLVRSNSNFKLSAVVESKTAELSQLSIDRVRATGMLVSPAAISGLNVLQEFDLHGKPETTPDVLDPMLVVTGPRVSTGGTLNSPNNALEITVLIRLQPQPTHGWLLHLTFVATPE